MGSPASAALSAAASLLGGSQVAEVRKKLLPLLMRLEYTVEHTLKNFPWNWEESFKHDAETFKRLRGDIDNLMQDLKNKTFMGMGLTLAVPAATFFGIQQVIKMGLEVINLVALIKDLLKIVELFKKGFDRVLAFLKDMVDIRKNLDRAYIMLKLAIDAAIRAALRKIEKIRQLVLLKIRLNIAEVKKESYTMAKKNLQARLNNNPPKNQESTLKNLIKQADTNIKEMKAEIDYCTRAMDELQKVD